MKSSSYWVERAKGAFIVGDELSIRDGDPHRLRSRLYQYVHRRGYRGWSFWVWGKRVRISLKRDGYL